MSEKVPEGLIRDLISYLNSREGEEVVRREFFGTTISRSMRWERRIDPLLTKLLFGGQPLIEVNPEEKGVFMYSDNGFPGNVIPVLRQIARRYGYTLYER